MVAPGEQYQIRGRDGPEQMVTGFAADLHGLATLLGKKNSLARELTTIANGLPEELREGQKNLGHFAKFTVEDHYNPLEPDMRRALQQAQARPDFISDFSVNLGDRKAKTRIPSQYDFVHTVYRAVDSRGGLAGWAVNDEAKSAYKEVAQTALARLDSRVSNYFEDAKRRIKDPRKVQGAVEATSRSIVAEYIRQTQYDLAELRKLLRARQEQSIGRSALSRLVNGPDYAFENEAGKAQRSIERDRLRFYFGSKLWVAHREELEAQLSKTGVIVPEAEVTKALAGMIATFEKEVQNGLKAAQEDIVARYTPQAQSRAAGRSALERTFGRKVLDDVRVEIARLQGQGVDDKTLYRAVAKRFQSSREHLSCANAMFRPSKDKGGYTLHNNYDT